MLHGKILVVVIAENAEEVEFFLCPKSGCCGIKVANDTQPPFEWLWDTPAFGIRVILVIAYYEGGEIAENSIMVTKIF